jgi:hypothetical protein
MVWKTVSITLAVVLAIFAVSTAIKADYQSDRFVSKAEFDSYTNMASEMRAEMKVRLANLQATQTEILAALRELRALRERDVRASERTDEQKRR